jgi:hypothetical protein
MAKKSAMPPKKMSFKDKMSTGSFKSKSDLPKFAKGGSIDGVAKKGKTSCKQVKM